MVLAVRELELKPAKNLFMKQLEQYPLLTIELAHEGASLLYAAP
jgi:hypothetical protein